MERAIQPLLLPVLKDPALTSADLAPVAAALASIDVSAVLQQEQRRIVNSLLSYRWRRYFGPAIVPLSVLGLYDYQAYHQLTLLKAAAGTFAEPPASWWRAIEPLCARAHAEEGNPLTSFIPGETARVLAQQLVSALQGVTLADALKCVVAIERYRRDQGAMPESLDALVPQYLDAVPVDYIGGGPLSFAVEGSGYRVRSAGVEPPARGTAPRRHFLRHAPELWGFEIAG